MVEPLATLRFSIACSLLVHVVEYLSGCGQYCGLAYHLTQIAKYKLQLESSMAHYRFECK